jgi:hypothetical protein
MLKSTKLNNCPLSQADRRLRGRLCGICGDFDGDTVKEFRKPQDTQARDAQEYASSYAIVDSDCRRGQTKYEENHYDILHLVPM